MSSKKVQAARAAEQDDDNTYVFEEVEVDDDSDDDMEYEEVPDEASDDSDEDDLEALMASLRPKDDFSSTNGDSKAKAKPAQDPAEAEVKNRPTVVDDFIRNFLIKLKMNRTLDTFQTEWYEMQQQGKLNEEDVGVVPDIYERNSKLDDQVKNFRTEVTKANEIARKAKGTWDKFRKERDYHRMHHRRVVQEKNSVVRDLKRLKKHYATYEPALAAIKKKYETAMKDKMLMRLERDRMQSKAEQLETQLANYESAKKGDPERAAKKKTTKPKKSKGNETPWPAADRVNPNLGKNIDRTPAEKFTLRSTFQGHTLAVAGMAVHPTKPIIATVSDDMTWKMWALPKGDLIMSGDGHKDWVAGCDFHPRGSMLATASGDSTVKLWDFMNACCAATLTDHTQAVWGVAFHDEGDFLASCSMDHTARVWDINTLKCRQTLRSHVDSVNSVAFQPYSNNLCTASGDKTVSLWDIRSGRCIQTFYGHRNAVMSVAFNPAGDTIVSGDADGVVKLWDVRMVGERYQIATANERHPVNEAQFDRSGKVIGVASDSGLVKVYNVEGSEEHELGSLEGHDGAVQCLRFDPRGQYLISGSSDASFRLWN